MASTVFVFEVRDSGALTAGLTPTWSSLYKLSDASSVASPDTAAPIAALGGGLYKITYDPEGVNGELAGVIDAGGSITADSDRYIAMTLAQDSSRVQRLDATVASRSTLDAAGVRTAVGLASANLDTQLGTIANTSGLTVEQATLLERIAGAAGLEGGVQTRPANNTIVETLPTPGGETITRTITKSGNTITVVTEIE